MIKTQRMKTTQKSKNKIKLLKNQKGFSNFQRVGEKFASSAPE